MAFDDLKSMSGQKVRETDIGIHSDVRVIVEVFFIRPAIVRLQDVERAAWAENPAQVRQCDREVLLREMFEQVARERKVNRSVGEEPEIRSFADVHIHTWSSAFAKARPEI